MTTSKNNNVLSKLAGLTKGSAILMILLGVAALCLPAYAGMSVAVLVGVLVLLAGVATLTSVPAASGAGGAIWRLLIGAAYLVGGVYLIAHPALGLVSLTMLMAVIFIVEGVSELLAYLSIRALPRAGVVLLNALITLALGVMIWEGWPSSAAWGIGTLIGVNLISTGLTRLMYGQVADKVAAAY